MAPIREVTIPAGEVSIKGFLDVPPDALGEVRAPTLLIVGELDTPVIRMNRAALAGIDAPRELTIVPGATHLFEEPGKLEEVARLSTGWFRRWLA